MRDIGANITNKIFHGKVPALVERARLAGITHIDITTTQLQAITESLYWVDQYPDFFTTTAGIHPHNAKTFKLDDLPLLEQYWADARVLMAGEMGLDSEHVYSSFDEQRFCFEKQLELACCQTKPLFLHFRGEQAIQEGLQLLAKFKHKPEVIVHCFTGNTQQAKAIVRAGYYIGITGWVTDIKRGAALREAVTEIPLERLMVETDAPYLMPLNRNKAERRQTNYPEYLPLIIAELAALLQMDKEQIAKTTESTANGVIGKAVQ